MTRKSTPQKMDQIMDAVLSSRGYLNICRESQVREKWREIVGERIAQVSECQGVENGVLYVRIPSAAWRQEVSFLRERILMAIRTQTQCETVTDIVFC